MRCVAFLWPESNTWYNKTVYLRMGAPLRLAPIKGQEPLLSSISEGVQPWNGGGAQIIFLFLPQPLAAAILWGGGHRGQKIFHPR